jgi:hypothetical protein
MARARVFGSNPRTRSVILFLRRWSACTHNFSDAFTGFNSHSSHSLIDNLEWNLSVRGALLVDVVI